MKKILPVLLCLVIGYLFWKDHEEQSASAGWTAVQGRIVSASVVTHRSKDDAQDTSEQLSYEPAVEYDYEVNGVRYTGKRIRISAPRYDSSALARDTIVMYQRTPTVTVYYDPADPGRSVLEHGCRSSAWRC